MPASPKALFYVIGRIVLLAAALLSAIIASVLFLVTGKPIPRSTEPIDGIENIRPVCISSCGQFGIKVSKKLVGNRGDQELEVWQLWPRKRITSFICGDGSCTNLSVNTRQDLLAVSGAFFCEVKSFPNGKAVCEAMYKGGTNPNILAFSKDSTRLVICTEHYAARVIDATTGKRTGEFLDRFDKDAGMGPSTLACYFGASDQAKAIMNDDAPTVWDIAQQRPAFRLLRKDGIKVDSPLSNEPLEGPRNCLVNPESSAVTTGHDDGKIRVWSLKNGELIREISIASPGSCYPLQFSADCTFLAVLRVPESDPNTWITWLPQSWQEPAQKLLMGDASITLVDLQSGTRWKGFPATELCACVDNGSTFLTWDKDLVVWDFPPKWEYFTPWAWAPLACCLLFGGLWWKSRGTPVRPVKPG